MNSSKPSQSLLVVDDLIRQRAAEPQQVSLIAYPDPKYDTVKYEAFTAYDIDCFVEAAARHLQSFWDSPSVIALLGPSNLEYTITLLGLSRLGHTVLILSPRLSTSACIELVKQTDSSAIIYAEKLTSHVNEILEQRPIKAMTIPKRVDFDSFLITNPRITALTHGSLAAEGAAFIMHSSGSTGVPKPIFQSHMACLENYSHGYNLRGLLTMPLHYAAGHACLLRAIYTQSPIYLLDSDLPLSSRNLIAAIENVRPEVLFTVPYGLKLLMETEEGISAMKTCKIVASIGSGCSDELGRRLTAYGIRLVSQYGSTEVGQLMNSIRPDEDSAWDYLRPLPSTKPYIHMQSIGQNVYELVVLDGLKSKTISNSNDPPSSFHTGDIFVRHSTISDAWKPIGRLDDRVTLANGEKIAPLPIEGRMKEESMVKEAVVFGNSRTIPGLLVFRSESAANVSDEACITHLWPTLEDVNSKSESIARISKDAIVLLPSDVAYPQTDKGTIIRTQIYSTFAAEIEKMYERIDNHQDGSLHMDIQRLTDWIINAVSNHLGISLENTNADFFKAGLDSSHAFILLGLIRKDLYLGTDSSQLRVDSIFDSPTPLQLAQHIYALQTGSIESSDNQGNQEMSELINQYSKYKPHVPATGVVNNSHVAIVTGATGSLGAHILARLLDLENIDTVYCLVRAHRSGNASTRLFCNLAERHIVLSEAQKAKVFVIQCDLSKDNLGLEELELETLRRLTTLIIHCAWTVNFNLTMRSFEEHIQAVHNLVNLSLSVHGSKPAQFVFCSSISVGTNTSTPVIVPEGLITDFTKAQPTGYARAKLVAEHIVQKAAVEAGACSRVIRIGQIVGDHGHGLWSDNDAIPLMIRSVFTLGALPTLDETCSWLPVDKVADIILDLIGIADDITFSNPSLVYNIVNPITFHWSKDLLEVLRMNEYVFDAVSTQEWIKRLEASDQNPQHNPSAKLTTFWSKKYIEGNSQPGCHIRISTKWTRSASASFREPPDLLEDGYIDQVATRWLRQWR